VAVMLVGVGGRPMCVCVCVCSLRGAECKTAALHGVGSVAMGRRAGSHLEQRPPAAQREGAVTAGPEEHALAVNG
jgi:hypothetical protein